MDEQEEVQHNNMISNLPLLFANGYPTSLEKITESQLEKFIPFMVQCSLGHINLQGKMECSEPEWWPETLPFTVPFAKPKKFVGNWLNQMKEVVIICYQFHKSVFLLRFCTDLASYEHASLRFINNYNSTTSLYDRRSNKLLVTFRNENMSYDQPQRSRKCLLQQKSKNGRPTEDESQQMMVEPPPFDIYLCEHCDAELYSKEAILVHEKTCHIEEEDDDDVILCDTPEPPDDGSQQPDVHNNTENNELRIGFLLNFNLQCCDDSTRMKNAALTEAATATPAPPPKEDNGFMIIDRNRRMPRRNRAVHSLTRCPTIPLSSPAGQLLLRTTKTAVTAEYLSERLERMERFCHAPLLTRANRPKYLEKRNTTSNPHCTFKKPQEYSSHMYVFPRRQFSQRRRTENFLFFNSPLIRRCRPISVRLKKITDNEMRGRKKPFNNNKLNIKLTRDAARHSNWKISSSPSTEIIVDTIDLCSSDDDESNSASNMNIDAATKTTLTQRAADSTAGVAAAAVNTIAAASVGSAVKPLIVATKTTNKVNMTQTCLKKLNTSEISLIPIVKAHLSTCTVQYDNINSSQLLKLTAPKETTMPLVNEEMPKGATSHYEGNLVVSPSTATAASHDGAASGKTLPKPLRPSVYIFSNYPANPLAALVTSSNELVTGTESANLRGQNQENHVQTINTGQPTIVTKRTNATIGNTSTTDWYQSSGGLTTNLHSGASGSNHTHSLVQSFGSPGRIVSIDLTS